MNYFPPELWADNSGEYLGEDSNPRLLMYDVQLLEPLTHSTREDMVCLEEPAPTRPVLLCRNRAVRIASEEDDLIFKAPHELVFLR